MKRVAIIADMHCGHVSGLTPPEYQLTPYGDSVLNPKIYEYQQQAWAAYEADVLALRENGVDCLIVNGDAIDGRGPRAGGNETMHLDRIIQAEIATRCIEIWNARKVFLIRGTPYHTGDLEQWEDVIAKRLRDRGAEVKIGDHDWIDVNGFVFDCKHKIGGSQIPHGRWTAGARQVLWSALWSEAGLTPRSDMVVRSHVHYHIVGSMCVGEKKRYFMTTPCLQGWTRYGGQQCSGLVDWGFLAFDIDDGGRIVKWHDRRHVIQSSIATVHRV